MKSCKKTLCAILACLMLALPLCACQTDDVGKATTAATSQLTPLENPIVLCDAAGSYYRVVRPKTTLSPINDSASMILDYPFQNGAANLVLRWGTDESEATDTEILVGYTNRPESIEVLKSIGFDDFAIVLKNNKIVVAAHSPQRLLEAATYLCKNLLQIQTNVNGKKELVFLGNYVYKSTITDYLFSDDAPLSNYVIVYKKDSQALKDAALALQETLKSAYGTELSVVDDSTPAASHEILIGNVDRPLAKKHIKTDGNLSFSYVTVAEGTTLLIGAAMDEISDYMMDAFCNQYVRPQYSYTLNVRASVNESGSSFDLADSPKLAEGANLRVMSFNILCELWNDKAKISGREIPVLVPIYTYKPDILGMQEVSDAWYAALDPLFGSTYAFVDRKEDNNQTNFSPLVYNTETLTLLEHGVKNLTPYNNALRVVSWGYFERKSDGARFLAINTHWNVNDDVEVRTAQAHEMAGFVLQMKEKYQCPVITTGDYNTRASDTQFSIYTSRTGLLDACQNAKVANRVYKTTHELFTQAHRGKGEAIDHIFLSNEIEILYYNVLIDDCLKGASDHTPIYADVKLTK